MRLVFPLLARGGSIQGKGKHVVEENGYVWCDRWKDR